MATITFPLLAAVLGALVYGLLAGKGSELGRLLYLAGVLVLVYVLAGRVVHL